MISNNGSRSGFESRREQVTATKLSPSDIGSVLDLFNQIGVNPYVEPPMELNGEVQSVDTLGSLPRDHDVVHRECASSIAGIQTQMLVELALVSSAVENTFPENRHLLNGELTELVGSFYRNQTDWKRELFKKIFPQAFSGRDFVNTLEELDQMENPSFDDFFGFVGGDGSENAGASIRRAFNQLRQNHVFHNYNRRNRLVEPHEGSVLSADQVMDIWFSRFGDREISQISDSVSALLSGEHLTRSNRELSRILNAVNLNTVTFEPVTIQQLCMNHPDRRLQHSFVMHLSAMTDIMIPTQQVFRPNGIGLYITPPIMIDVKTGKQMFDPLDGATEKEEIETLAYILAGARSRIAQKPNANGTGIRTKAEATDVRRELNTIAMRPWHYCRLYHFDPTTGSVSNLMPFIFLPDRVKAAYINQGKRLPLTEEEQQEMYQKLVSAYERLEILSDWIRLNKQKKPWRKDEKRAEYIMPKLMKPGQEYALPAK